MRRTTIALLLVLAGTLFAAWFFTTHEKVTRQEFIGYQGEARFNQFLAAELLLQELGFEADGRSSLTPSEWLPPSSDTLVTRSSAAISFGAERQTLDEWVTNGGHLVLLPAQQDSRLTDEFLYYLGFRFVEVDEDESDAESEDDADSGSYMYILDLEFTRFRIEAHEEGAFDATLSDGAGIVVARRPWGDGFITAIADPSYFINYSIGELDHARLLLDVTAGYFDPGKVWFIYDSAFPALWQVIWAKVPFAVVALAAALLLWLWSITPMFGPALAPASTERRSIVEHIRAAGHFAWRHRGAKALATTSAAAIVNEAESRHPGIGRLSLENQARQLARITGLGAQEILDALVNQAAPRHREFTHSMQALQRIRNEL